MFHVYVRQTERQTERETERQTERLLWNPQLVGSLVHKAREFANVSCLQGFPKYESDCEQHIRGTLFAIPPPQSLRSWWGVAKHQKT
jgi:hypothetical protein